MCFNTINRLSELRMSANIVAFASNERGGHGFIPGGRGGRSFYRSNQTSSFKVIGKAETL